jgi:hypothetical protein
MLSDADRAYPALTGFQGRQLTLSYSPDYAAWVLQHRKQPVGQVSITRHGISGAAGAWRVDTAGRSSPIVFQPVRGTELVAAYYRRRLLRGGTIVLPSNEAYLLRPNAFTGRSRLADMDRNNLLTITRRRAKLMTLSVELHNVHEPESTMLLITLATICLLLQFETPSTTTGGM